ncbi:PP2C family protein-serine/threonine phosphatase [Xylanimonas ulmi]|uniref:Protein phosphatase n=1 Tax=Xylanimonas ulmi TaxID=228973 RepID=A0A4V2EYI4_9MICO|nr:protein phosphatase 2C domain-containing protein [Xylanibacterium ulmi]RZS63100.1 protein phosphatase [Xylanibacterium ulmi]
MRGQEHCGVVLRWGVMTDTGRRRALNEDHFVASAPVFAVADGMGGQDAGDLASAAAVAALGALGGLTAVSQADVEDVLGRAHAAVRRIETQPGREAGTTVTGAVVVPGPIGPQWLVVNVGDSRTYLQAQGRLERLTVDHSEVQEMVDAGVITRAQARTHPRRHVITRALGAPAAPRADFWWLPVEADDRLLVCSDGLTSELDDVEIADILRAEADPQAAARALVAAALAAGGRDNITAVVVDALEVAGAVDDCDDDTRPRPAGAVSGGGR